jgi:hypothetical protein
VVKWEGSKGKIDIRRKATLARLQAIRGMGKKEAAQILGLGKKSKGKAPRKTKRNPKPA